MAKENVNQVYFFLSMTAVFWGGNAVAAKYVVSEISPLVTVFFRIACMSIILFGYVFWQEGKKALPPKKIMLTLVAMGIFSIPLNNGLQYTGLQISTAVNCTLVSAINPAFTALLSFFIFKEHLSRQQRVGVAVSLVGVVIIVSRGDWIVLANLSFNYGDILFVLSQICWSVYTVLGRVAMRHLSPLATTAWACAMGDVFIGMQAVASGWNGTIQLSTVGWGCMLYMIFGSGLLAFCWWNRGVAVVGPNKAAIFTNAVPLSGMIASCIFLKEGIGVAQIFGALLIISGVMLTTQTSDAMSLRGAIKKLRLRVSG